MAPQPPRSSHTPQTRKPSPAPARGEQPEIDLEIKRSHFLGRIARADDEEEARAFVAQVRALHPDARHHCSAFVVSRPGAAPVERSSDDGEPSGTAGRPMLDVLRASGLTRAVVVVTRYFGGTLLGTGGLVRAYSEATSMALDAADLVLPTTRHLWDVRVPVSEAGRLEAELRAAAGRGTGGAADLSVEETVWGADHAVMLLATGSPEAEGLTELLASLTAGGVSPHPAGTRSVEVPMETPRH